MDKKRVMVVPAFSGAGASFISSSLAVFAADREDEKKRREKGLLPRVTLAEPAAARFFSEAGMEERFVSRRFVSFCEAIEKGESIREICNSRSGVNCLFRVPGRDGQLSLPGLFRLISSAPGELLIFDCSSMPEELLRDAAAEADKKILVIDPLPARLIESAGFISRFLLRFPDSVIAVNRMNPGVRRAELARFLGRRSFIAVPHLAPETVYKAQYSCLFPAELDEGRAVLAPAMGELAEALA